MQPKKEVLAFWDKPDFADQVKLIAGPVPWEVSVETAPYHCSLIATEAVRTYLDEIRKTRDPSILEVGCGVGRLLKPFWMAGAEVVGVDLSPNMIKKAKEYLSDTINRPRLHVTKGDLSMIPSRSMDFVYSFLVFQHIQTAAEVKKYIDEALRVLKPGGYLRVQTHLGEPHPEGRFGGFHGRFYPTLESFAAEFKRPKAEVVGQDQGLGFKNWLWVTVRKN